MLSDMESSVYGSVRRVSNSIDNPVILSEVEGPPRRVRDLRHVKAFPRCSMHGENSPKRYCQPPVTRGPSTALPSASRTTTSLRMTELEDCLLPFLDTTNETVLSAVAVTFLACRNRGCSRLDRPPQTRAIPRFDRLGRCELEIRDGVSYPSPWHGKSHNVRQRRRQTHGSPIRRHRRLNDVKAVVQPRHEPGQ